MPTPRRKIDPYRGQAALQLWLESEAKASPSESTAQNISAIPREELATAIRYTLEELSAQNPGNSVEVRVPPFGVTQCLAGLHHHRGTPPNVIEAAPTLWLRLATGKLSWEEALDAGVQASGTRADLSGLLPLF